MKVVMLSKAMVVGSYQRKAELMAELAGAELELVVAVPPLWRDGSLERRLERRHERGYRLVETAIRRPGDFHLHRYPDLAALLQREAPDLVHVDEEPYNLATWLALRAARRRGARSLFFSWQNLSRRYPPPFRWFERAAYRWVDGAIAGSETAARVLREKGYAGRLWVIPQFGVDEDRFHPPAPDARWPAERSAPLVIGYAGRLVEAKGVDLLLKALARWDGALRRSGPEAEAAGTPDAGAWRLELVGQGEARASLEAQAHALGIEARIVWRPWLPSAEMPAFYQGLDLLVLPSRSTPSWIEQFGRVLIEAMACGTVCVGSDSGEIPHVLGNAGLTFAEGDAAALAALLERLAADPVLGARLAAAGRARVLERFTMRRVAEATLSVYRELVSAGAGDHDIGRS